MALLALATLTLQFLEDSWITVVYALLIRSAAGTGFASEGVLHPRDPKTILEELRRDFSGDLEIGGPTLAAGFIRRSLVDDYALVVLPVILGGGTPFFPDLERPAGLRLLETRTFSSGAVYLGFAAR